MVNTAVHNFGMGQGEEESTGKQAPHGRCPLLLMPLSTGKALPLHVVERDALGCVCVWGRAPIPF